MLVQRWYADAHISTNYQREPNVSLLSGIHNVHSSDIQENMDVILCIFKLSHEI